MNRRPQRQQRSFLRALCYLLFKSGKPQPHELICPALIIRSNCARTEHKPPNTMKRKTKLLHYGFSLLTGGVALLSVTTSVLAADKKPNILVIWGDDIGMDNISYNSHGLMGYQTPNIDRIAREGVSFTDYYAQQSCTAGRAAFISGSVPVRSGMTKV